MVTLTLKCMAWDEGTLIPEVKSMFCFKVVIGDDKVGITETNNTFIKCNVYMLVMKLLHQTQYNYWQRIQAKL
jgi:hypothetical protein